VEIRIMILKIKRMELRGLQRIFMDNQLGIPVIECYLRMEQVQEHPVIVELLKIPNLLYY
jgi:hypothetical protein